MTTDRTIMLKRGALLLCLFAGTAAATAGAPAFDTQARVQVGFSPAGTAQQTVLDAISSARHEILVAAFNFPSKPVSQALTAAKQRGVDVRVVADKKANSHYTAVTYLANQGVPVMLNDRYSYMHNKFMVIDGNAVETGSFNYSAGAAMHNAENVLWLRNVPDVAAQYRQEFLRLWQESEPLAPRY